MYQHKALLYPFLASLLQPLIYRQGKRQGEMLLLSWRGSSRKRGDTKAHGSWVRHSNLSCCSTSVSFPVTNQSQQLILLASNSEPKMSSSSRRSLGDELPLSPTSLWQKLLHCKRKHTFNSLGLVM